MELLRRSHPTPPRNLGRFRLSSLKRRNASLAHARNASILQNGREWWWEVAPPDQAIGGASAADAATKAARAAASRIVVLRRDISRRRRQSAPANNGAGGSEWTQQQTDWLGREAWRAASFEPLDRGVGCHARPGPAELDDSRGLTL